MTATIPWIAASLGITTLAFIAFAWWTVKELRARSAPLTPEERAERIELPMTPLQKGAWWGLGVGLAQAGVILGVFLSRGGPAGYWEDDGMRMLVLASICR